MLCRLSLCMRAFVFSLGLLLLCSPALVLVLKAWNAVFLCMGAFVFILGAFLLCSPALVRGLSVYARVRVESRRVLMLCSPALVLVLRAWVVDLLCPRV